MAVEGDLSVRRSILADIGDAWGVRWLLSHGGIVHAVNFQTRSDRGNVMLQVTLLAPLFEDYQLCFRDRSPSCGGTGEPVADVSPERPTPLEAVGVGVLASPLDDPCSIPGEGGAQGVLRCPVKLSPYPEQPLFACTTCYQEWHGRGARHKQESVSEHQFYVRKFARLQQQENLQEMLLERKERGLDEIVVDEEGDKDRSGMGIAAEEQTLRGCFFSSAEGGRNKEVELEQTGKRHLEMPVFRGMCGLCAVKEHWGHHVVAYDCGTNGGPNHSQHGALQGLYASSRGVCAKCAIELDRDLQARDREEDEREPVVDTRNMTERLVMTIKYGLFQKMKHLVSRVAHC